MRKLQMKNMNCYIKSDRILINTKFKTRCSEEIVEMLNKLLGYRLDNVCY